MNIRLALTVMLWLMSTALLMVFHKTIWPEVSPFAYGVLAGAASWFVATIIVSALERFLGGLDEE